MLGYRIVKKLKCFGKVTGFNTKKGEIYIVIENFGKAIGTGEFKLTAVNDEAKSFLPQLTNFYTGMKFTEDRQGMKKAHPTKDVIKKFYPEIGLAELKIPTIEIKFYPSQPLSLHP